MKKLICLFTLGLSLSAFAEGDFNNRWNLAVELGAGRYDSKGDVSLTFNNAGQYPTLTSGEKIPLNLDGAGSVGLLVSGGYRFHDWASISAMLVTLSAKSESTYTTSTGSTHSIKTETGFVYISPATWTGYPLPWLNLSAGVGIVAEAHKVSTNITNIGDYETGSAGSGVHLGVGVEFPLSNMFTLGGGLKLISGRLISQEKKLNEGLSSEVTAKLHDRSIGVGLLTFGTKMYF